MKQCSNNMKGTHLSALSNVIKDRKIFLKLVFAQRIHFFTHVSSHRVLHPSTRKTAPSKIRLRPFKPPQFHPLSFLRRIHYLTRVGSHIRRKKYYKPSPMKVKSLSLLTFFSVKQDLATRFACRFRLSSRIQFRTTVTRQPSTGKTHAELVDTARSHNGIHIK